MEFTESWWSGFYTFTGGFILAILAIAYRSKCDQMNLCWGMIEVHRNVDAEIEADLHRVEQPREAD
jgi:hypothetical protein